MTAATVAWPTRGVDPRRHLVAGMRPGRVNRTLRHPHDHSHVLAYAGDEVPVGAPDACDVVAFLSPTERMVRFAHRDDVTPLEGS